MPEVVTAVFRNQQDAQSAIDHLRQQNVLDTAISVISKHSDEGGGAGKGGGDANDAGKGALSGLGIGAGVGALFGLAAAAIPGIGPFIAAGALAEVLGVTGGAAVAGAIVGGTSGGIAGALSHWGLNEAESGYYANEVDQGGILIGVDLSRTSVDRQTILSTLHQYNGSSSISA